MTACNKHRETPVKGYSQCAGCEIDALRTQVAELRAQLDQRIPCDVMLPPATTIKRGCPLSTVLTSMKMREDVPPNQRVFTATPAPEVRQEPEALPDSEFVNEFMDWWEKHGQYVRSGGGDYERTFAFEAWRYLMPKVRAAEQGERQEVAAYLHTLHMELDQSQSVVSQSQHNPFGVRGENYDDAYSVTTLPLYTTPQPGPDVRGLVEALEWCEDWFARHCPTFKVDGFFPTVHPMLTSIRNALAAHRQAQQGGSNDT